MFTGIIETVGTISSIEQEGSNYHFDIQSKFSFELKVDQSVSHNGVCLTVVAVHDDFHRVTAIDETLQKTSLGQWKVGDKVNLERCMVANGRFDGHVVQGHVDQIGTVTDIQEQDGSWLFDFEYDPSEGNVTVEKGSVCINGTSLTCFNSEEGKFRVAIIPYTYEHTVFRYLRIGDQVNLEFDIIGKYVKRLLEKK
ncbi:riboflavin synthase [Roseivirga sp.]|uniref:riboflavin synthase n=1 Tax=Roseivirga sp. TaxID=1964215 RepID=UPI003B5202DA